MRLLRLSILLSLLGLTGYAATFGTVTPALGAADLILDQPRGRLYLINSNLNRVQVYFFFSSRRRHTSYWRDWSSDVCSSDLELDGQGGGRRGGPACPGQR